MIDILASLVLCYTVVFLDKSSDKFSYGPCRCCLFLKQAETEPETLNLGY